MFNSVFDHAIDISGYREGCGGGGPFLVLGRDTEPFERQIR